MTIDEWLRAAIAHARRRGRPELEPLLEALAEATAVLRAAGFNESADGVESDASPPSAAAPGRAARDRLRKR